MSDWFKGWLRKREQRKFGIAPPDLPTFFIRASWILAAVVTVVGAFLYASGDTGSVS